MDRRTIQIQGDSFNMVLPVCDPYEYDGKFPLYKQPYQIGIFSVDKERRFCPDDRNVKYLTRSVHEIEPVMDLNKGFDVAIRKDQMNNERLDLMLHYVFHNVDKVKTNLPPKNPSDMFGADFICYRGLLTALACTPYESRDDWIICATKFKGSIYLCAFNTERRILEEQRRTLRDSQMSFWGYKFEQYMMSDSPDCKPDPESILNEKEEFCVAFKGQLNKHVLLCSAEIDGIDPQCPRDEKSTACYIELKTSRIITSSNQDMNFCRHKTRKYWAQSFLVGIPKVLCGFRDDQGIVREVEDFSTNVFPKMGQNYWSPSAMMNFLDLFLSFVKQTVTEDDSRIVYKFEWRPGQPITGKKLSSSMEYQILPDWYIRRFQ